MRMCGSSCSNLIHDLYLCFKVYEQFLLPHFYVKQLTQWRQNFGYQMLAKLIHLNCSSSATSLVHTWTPLRLSSLRHFKVLPGSMVQQHPTNRLNIFSQVRDDIQCLTIQIRKLCMHFVFHYNVVGYYHQKDLASLLVCTF